MNRSLLGSVALLISLVLGAHRELSAAAWPPQEIHFKHSHPAQETQLLKELEEVLEKMQHKKISTWEKKFNQVPKCSFGDLCAVRKGARIGKLCDCPRRSACNAFLLKCL